jgi:hypothetical protein
MLLYNWNKVFNSTGGDVFDIYLVLKMLTNKEIPENKYDKIYKYSDIDYKGESFLLHPDVLLFNRYKHSYREIAQYLGLASLRSLAEYTTSGKLTLDLFMIDVDPGIINENSLLRVEDGQVHFLYEEVNKENIH